MTTLTDAHTACAIPVLHIAICICNTSGNMGISTHVWPHCMPHCCHDSHTCSQVLLLLDFALLIIQDVDWLSTRDHLLQVNPMPYRLVASAQSLQGCPCPPHPCPRAMAPAIIPSLQQGGCLPSRAPTLHCSYTQSLPQGANFFLCIFVEHASRSGVHSQTTCAQTPPLWHQ